MLPEYVRPYVLVAVVGNGRAFAHGRNMAAWLGLVPRQMTTGGKPKLLGIRLARWNPRMRDMGLTNGLRRGRAGRGDRRSG
jgi:hypothetical protein